MTVHFYKTLYSLLFKGGIDIPFKIKRDDTPTFDYSKSVKKSTPLFSHIREVVSVLLITSKIHAI